MKSCWVSSASWEMQIKTTMIWGFPGSAAVRTLCFLTAEGIGSTLRRDTKILPAVRSTTKTNKKPKPTMTYYLTSLSSVSSVAQSCPTLCDPMNRSTPGHPQDGDNPKWGKLQVARIRETGTLIYRWRKYKTDSCLNRVTLWARNSTSKYMCKRTENLEEFACKYS